MEIEPRFFNPLADIARRVNRLPHWQQPGATYFLTYRLADSIPKTVMDGWMMEREIWINSHPKPWTSELTQEFERRAYSRIEGFLDELHGACLLRSAEVAGLTGDVLSTFDGKRYLHHTWVVMPNHVHALFTLREGCALDQEVKAWKGVSAHRINRALARNGELWQKDYFDRLVRNAGHFWRCARYIRRNPAKARLNVGEFLLYESAAVRTALDPPDSRP